MTDKPDGKRWRWGTVAWIVVLLMVLYVLSVGPAYRYCFDYHFDHAATIAYRPIFALGTFGLTGDVLSWYLNLWGSGWKAVNSRSDHEVLFWFTR
jgi:hypothetical protein